MTSINKLVPDGEKHVDLYIRLDEYKKKNPSKYKTTVVTDSEDNTYPMSNIHTVAYYTMLGDLACVHEGHHKQLCDTQFKELRPITYTKGQAIRSNIGKIDLSTVTMVVDLPIAEYDHEGDLICIHKTANEYCVKKGLNEASFAHVKSFNKYISYYGEIKYYWSIDDIETSTKPTSILSNRPVLSRDSKTNEVRLYHSVKHLAYMTNTRADELLKRLRSSHSHSEVYEANSHDARELNYEPYPDNLRYDYR